MNIADPTSLESSNVHDVYQRIAPHFSQTRYKPWPLITSFLSSLPAGSVGVDLGCGNGKYLPVNPNVYILASDRSSNLVALASSCSAKGKSDVLVGDLLDNPHPNARFDFAISIAVVHHFASRERRVVAVRAILDALVADGRALVYVWALEQKSSRRGWDEGGEQDVFVPWVMAKRQGQQNRKKKDEKDEEAEEKGEEEKEKEGSGEVMQRYYHLYRKGELEEDVATAGGVVVDSGYEKDNWWVIMRRATTTTSADANIES